MADEQELFERIWYGERDGLVDLGLDLKLLNKPGSPVYRLSDNMLPWLAFVCLVVVGWRLGGWVGAAAAGASMLILFATTINFAVNRRLRQRAMNYALSGKVGFDDLWRRGVVSLRIAGEATSEIKGPAQDWRDFAQRRLPRTKAARPALAE